MTLSKDWMDNAACAQSGGDFWYADETPQDQESVTRAQNICRQCPVQTQCLEYALLTDERFGIWGGVTAKTRLRMRRKRGIPPRSREERQHGTVAGAAQHRRRKEKVCVLCLRGEAAAKRARLERRENDG